MGFRCKVEYGLFVYGYQFIYICELYIFELGFANVGKILFRIVCPHREVQTLAHFERVV